MEIVVPSFIAMFVSIPDSWVIRMVCEKDDEVYTFCAVTWDLETDRPLQGKWAVRKIGSFKPLGPDRCVLTAFEACPSWMPMIILRPIMRNLLPGRLTGQVAAFKAYRKQTLQEAIKADMAKAAEAAASSAP